MSQSAGAPFGSSANGISVPIKVNKWNIQEVRVAFDDSVVKFMNEEAKFKEDHFIIYSKLLVYFLLNLVGVSTALYSYLVKPFERTRLLVAVGSGIYLVCAGIWNLILQYRITATLYRGRDTAKEAKKQVWIRSGMKYPQAIYSLCFVSPVDGKVVGEAVEFGVGDWVNLEGFVLYDVIVKDLQSKLLPLLKHD